MRSVSIVVFGALLILAQSANALVIERVTSVSDDQGGRLSISSTGDAFADGGSSQSDLVANNFSARGDAAISGELTRSRSRGGEVVSAVYNGTVTITAATRSETLTVVLSDLTVTREGDGPSMSGTVTLNGNALDASELPERARAALGRVLRLFSFD